MSTLTIGQAVAEPPIQQMVPDTKTLYLCSVYPKRLEWESMYRSPVFDPQTGKWRYHNLTRYVMPAAPKGEYRVIAIYPAQIYKTGQPVEIEGVDGPIGSNLQLTRAVAFVPPKTIIGDLLNHWVNKDAHYGNKDAHIGIGQIADPEPTKAELDYLNAVQQSYFEKLVAYGTNQLAAQGRFAELQEGSGYHLAAVHIGANVDWLKPIAPKSGTKRCIACGQNIDADITVCFHCSRDLVTFAQTRRLSPAEVRAKGDSETALAMERLDGTAAAKAPAAPAPPPAAAAEAPKTMGQIAREKAAKRLTVDES